MNRTHGDRDPRAAGAGLVTIAMLAVLTASASTVSSIAVLAPEIAPSMGLDPKSIGGYIALTYVFAMFAGTLSGTWIRRYGPIRVCQLALVSGAAAMLTLTSARLPAAVLSAMLAGLCYGPFNPASAHVLVRVSTPRRRALVFSVKQTGVPLGGAIAGLAIAPLAVAAGWQTALVACALGALVVAMAIAPLRRTFDAERDTGTTLARLDLVGPLRVALGSAQLRTLTLAAFAYAGCQVAVGAFFVVYLIERLGISLVASGALFAFVQAGGFCGRILWGSIAGPSVPARRLLAALGAAIAACLIATGSIDSSWSWGAIAALAAVLGLCTFGWNGVLLAEIAALAPGDLAGEATGGLQFVMFGGVVLIPAAFGSAAAAAGFGSAFVAMSTLAAAGALLAAAGRAQPR